MIDEERDLTDQYQKPIGDDGREVMEGMNSHHSPLWDFCLQYVKAGIEGNVLDVGCGGGGLIKRLRDENPGATVYGTDISDDALRMSCEINFADYREKKVRLSNQSADDMDFDDRMFDLITAMQTYFFWPDLKKAFPEIRRVLADGGTFVIGSGQQVREDNLDKIPFAKENWNATLYRDSDLVSMLEDAGFKVERHEKPEIDYVVFLCTKA